MSFNYKGIININYVWFKHIVVVCMLLECLIDDLIIKKQPQRERIYNYNCIVFTVVINDKTINFKSLDVDTILVNDYDILFSQLIKNLKILDTKKTASKYSKLAVIKNLLTLLGIKS